MILRERLVVAMERLMGLILVAVAIEMMLRAAEGWVSTPPIDEPKVQRRGRVPSAGHACHDRER